QEYPPRAGLIRHAEPAFESHKIAPCLAAFQRDSDHGFGAVSRARDGFGGGKGSVPHAACNVHGYDFKPSVWIERRADDVQGFPHGIQLWAAGSSHSNQNRLYLV